MGENCTGAGRNIDGPGEITTPSPQLFSQRWRQRSTSTFCSEKEISAQTWLIDPAPRLAKGEGQNYRKKFLAQQSVGQRATSPMGL